MPELRLVTDVDAAVAKQVKKTGEALARMAIEEKDRGIRVRECYEWYETPSKKRAIRLIEAAMDQEAVENLSAISIHAEWEAQEGGAAPKVTYIVKLWSQASPRLYDADHFRAAILWGRALGVEYAGWQSQIVAGG